MEASQRTLPPVPVKHAEFLSYLEENPDTPVLDLLEPFKQYDRVLREVFAQEPSHPAIQDNNVNVVPVYSKNGTNGTKVRARDLDSESETVKEQYIMPLRKEDRRAHGSPALVDNFKDFQTNFNLFSENALSDLDWSNVVAAGSSVVTPLLPVPKEYQGSKRNLRSYYHEILAPASDVDLFLYGLTEDEAKEKIKQIERSIRDAILEETTTVRTKNAITIASRYPTRHVQIVLRIYKSVSEILTGFDVDSSCAAYDGKQVYVAPRGLAAYVTQINPIDLSRRSPSYENRLSKYSHRGFEVFYPDLDRSRVDPTIFERSFSRTVGLARLLILEKLPKSTDREAYVDQRRRERGRPQIDRYNRYRHSLQGNIKEQHEDEVAEWVDQDEVSDYHTFTVPYGEKFHAKKIEKLLYTKDILLNAEWNRPKDREVNLHRHPAFFGYAEDVMGDCCGYCPKPGTLEEEEVAEEESKVYVSGGIDFIKDDPGRQSIGSFNPITETDWTEMAYVGNTARLCQAIVDHDLEHVQDWVKQEGSDPNQRDITGRTPLHLACMVSTPEIVECLIANDARMVARLADGRTSLHLAAACGNAAIVKLLLTRSELNAEEHATLEEQRRESKLKARKENDDTVMENADDEVDEDMDDVELLEADSDEEMDEDGNSRTTGSFVKVNAKNDESDNIPDDESKEGPDIFDVDVLSWDSQASPLHLAIVHGHIDVVEELAGSFGADILLPIKLLNNSNKSPRGAILTLVLALNLPLEQAKLMAAKLLELGASSAQADMNQTTALHYYGTKQPEALDVLFEKDGPAVKRAINHLAVGGGSYNPTAWSPLMSAIAARNPVGALKLLAGGANASVEFTDYINSVMLRHREVANRANDVNLKNFGEQLEQPIITAVLTEQPGVALELLKRGASPNSLTRTGFMVKTNEHQRNYHHGQTLLDIVRERLTELRTFEDKEPLPAHVAPCPEDDQHYLSGLENCPYRIWQAKRQLSSARANHRRDVESNEKRLEEWRSRKGTEEKKAAIHALAKEFGALEDALIQGGEAKSFYELYPDIEQPTQNNSGFYQSSRQTNSKPKEFELKFSFRVPDLTDETREAYLTLFDAAYVGDIDKIKELTLAGWGPDQQQIPLKIAIQDDQSNSPFSLAFFQGHFDAAKAVLEIARAQYQPREEEARERFSMNPEDSDEETTEDDDEIQVYGEIIDDKFTVDIIQELSDQVKSRVSPRSLLTWSSPVWQKNGDKYAFALASEDSAFDTPAEDRQTDPMGFAIWTDDLDLLRRVLQLDSEYKDAKDQIFIVTQSDFEYAIKLGRTRLLPELIKHSGVGIPIEDLVEKSGVEVKEKPKYYQGLTVHGRKRADWAQAGRNMGTQPQHKDPPLLFAAFQARVESVEFFLSPAPLRHYNEFADANQNDKRLVRLSQAEGGVDKAISNWLSSRCALALHCAVMAEPSARSTRLVTLLLKEMPDALETRSVDGYTPLALAYALRRTEIAKVLVQAGADQTVRDYKGNNLLHLLIHGYPVQFNSHVLRTYSSGFSTLVSLLDPRLVPSLVVERTSEGNPGSLTPLALWLSLVDMSHIVSPANPPTKQIRHSLAILTALLSLSAANNHAELEMLNAAGNSPVHDAVRQNEALTLQVLLTARPDLINRETATGATPVELAQDAWDREILSNPPALSHGSSHQAYGRRLLYGYSRSDYATELLNRAPDSFLPQPKSEERSAKRVILDMCLDASAKHPGGRKLVSLVEANEVVKRIAGLKTGRNAGRYPQNGHRTQEGDGSEDRRSDEVTQWGNQAIGWNENIKKDKDGNEVDELVGSEIEQMVKNILGEAGDRND